MSRENLEKCREIKESVETFLKRSIISITSRISKCNHTEYWEFKIRNRHNDVQPVLLVASSELLAGASWLTAWRHQLLCLDAAVSDTRARTSRLASSPWGLSRANARDRLGVWLGLLPLSSNEPSRTWTAKTSPRQKKDLQKFLRASKEVIAKMHSSLSFTRRIFHVEVLVPRASFWP